MRQFLHLFIVNSTLDAALATRIGSRCLLPIITAPDSSRIESFVRRWLYEHQIDGQAVGQWLGQASLREAAADWLVPIQAGEGREIGSSSGLQWTGFENLKTSDWHLDYQEWAVARLLAPRDVASVPGPFGRLGWLSEVREWIRGALGEAHCALLEITGHRLSSYEVVLECRTATGHWFFKGLSVDRAPEATLTSVMSQLMPASFASTVALEFRADGSAWWLMRACTGTLLTERPTSDRVGQVVAAFAFTQQVVHRELAEGRHLPVTHLDLSVVSAWSTSLVEAAAVESGCRERRASIERAFADVRDTSWSWVAGDLDPSNVIVDGPSVRFIDLDDAVIGPAALAVATLLRRLERAAPSNGWNAEWSTHVVDAYEHAWTPSLHLTDHWRSIVLVSECLECYLAWQRVELKTKRGEVSGVLELVRSTIQRRLLRAIAQHQAPAPVT